MKQTTEQTTEQNELVGMRFPTKEEKDEIINALYTIKAVCNRFDKCKSECPFYKNEMRECLVTYNSPSEWIVCSLETWKALF